METPSEISRRTWRAAVHAYLVRVFLEGRARRVCYVVPGHNFAAFDRARVRLERAGYDVVSPADLARGYGVTEATEPSAVVLAMIKRACLRELATCEAIAVLSGWQDSEGARVEMTGARWIGLVLLDAETGWKLEP